MSPRPAFWVKVPWPITAAKFKALNETPQKIVFLALDLKIHNYCLKWSYPLIFIQHQGMIRKFISPAPYVHPTGTTIIFFICEQMAIWRKNFKSPLCTWWVHIMVQGFSLLGVKSKYLKCIWWWKFLKILQPNPKGILPYRGTHFRRAIKFVLEILYCTQKMDILSGEWVD